MTMERRGSEPIIEDTHVIRIPDYGADMLAELNSLRVEGALTDAVLCADGTTEYPCHRSVLAVSSPYFRAMFSNDLRESRQGRIVLNDISSTTLGLIISYAYTGTLEITVENAQDLLAAGSLLQYPRIIEACCQFLSKHLHPSNCLGIENFAHLHCCNKLEIEAHQYTMENFSCVIEHEEFLQVPVERLQTYLASDLIDVRNEEVVHDAAMQWIQVDTSRQKYFCSILENIRLATIEVSYLEEVVQKHVHVLNCDICSMRVEEAKRYHESKTEEHEQRRRSMQKDTPRPSTMAREMLVVLGGMRLNAVLTSVEMYDPLKDKWLPLQDMPQPVSWFSACVLHNDIYVTGGILDGHIVPQVLRFESAKRRWSSVAPMLHPRARHASVTWNNCLYVLGGINLVVNTQIRTVESIERYDPATNTWTEVGQSPVPRKQSHVQAFNSTLVEIGGTKGDGVAEDTLESYICHDAAISYSGEQFKLPDCIQFGQILLLNNLFYIVWEDTKKVISLNPERRTFRRLCDLHSTHIHSGSAILGEKLYVSGGLADSKATRIVECYEPATDKWKPVKYMRQPRACHGCVTIKIA